MDEMEAARRQSVINEYCSVRARGIYHNNLDGTMSVTYPAVKSDKPWSIPKSKYRFIPWYEKDAA